MNCHSEVNYKVDRLLSDNSILRNNSKLRVSIIKNTLDVFSIFMKYHRVIVPSCIPKYLFVDFFLEYQCVVFKNPKLFPMKIPLITNAFIVLQMNRIGHKNNNAYVLSIYDYQLFWRPWPCLPWSFLSSSPWRRILTQGMGAKTGWSTRREGCRPMEGFWMAMVETRMNVRVPGIIFTQNYDELNSDRTANRG